MTTKERDYYTVTEAAERLDVSRSTVWRWIEAHRLPAYRVGPRTLRIRRADVDRLAQPPTLDEDPAFAAFLRRLNQPVTAEEIARRTKVVARILAHREKLDIRPLTTADLIHQAREKSVYDDDPSE